MPASMKAPTLGGTWRDNTYPGSMMCPGSISTACQESELGPRCFLDAEAKSKIQWIVERYGLSNTAIRFGYWLPAPD